MCSCRVSSHQSVVACLGIKFSNQFYLSNELEKGSTSVTITNPQSNFGGRWCYLHFTGKETEAQLGGESPDSGPGAS